MKSSTPPLVVCTEIVEVSSPLTHQVLPARAEPPFRLAGVVGPAAQFEIVYGRRATIRVRHAMVILEKAALGAPPQCAEEGALALVPLPDRTFHRGRDMPTGAAKGCRTRPTNVRVSRPLQLRQQHRQRTFEDGC